MELERYEQFGDAIRRRRRELGLSQNALADRIGTSRQNLAEIEAGRRMPQLTLASQLAHALGWTLDDLDRQLDRVDARMRWLRRAVPPDATPVVWSRMAGHLLLAEAGQLAPQFAVDAVWDAGRGTLVEVPGSADPLKTLFVAGCDPFLEWLWQRTPHPEMHLYIFSMGSEAAIAALSRSEVQVAGTHLYDEASGRYNDLIAHLPFETQRWPYLYWETGVMGALEKPDGWVLRERGSEARALFERSQRQTPLEQPITVELDSHWAIARYISIHPNLAGVGLGAVAGALGLPFKQWAHEPYEWVTRAEWMGDPRLKAFESWLKSAPVTRALASLPRLHPWSS
ncbi:MAG: hypothetical protein C7B45_03865 [Sulfobacillus acidophilus]|uniref:HTH cro/C1-type domain-containing protein n=1 Tax=Sulfobacillus acidophilus TaxID=53633 RepID=A0A2T2WLY4_9FIRM|nr:MAG: hypothetical protein C7B45_03865 [Sulfobacillus acidophilus]